MLAFALVSNLHPRSGYVEPPHVATAQNWGSAQEYRSTLMYSIEQRSSQLADWTNAVSEARRGAVPFDDLEEVTREHAKSFTDDYQRFSGQTPPHGYGQVNALYSEALLDYALAMGGTMVALKEDDGLAAGLALQSIDIANDKMQRARSALSDLD